MSDRALAVLTLVAWVVGAAVVVALASLLVIGAMKVVANVALVSGFFTALVAGGV